MQLLAFRIKNFRSIVDTNWCFFSRDQVTVLVGQNESGKTSILEALDCFLGHGKVTEDDRRAASPEPEMFVRCKLTPQDFDEVEDMRWSAEQKGSFWRYFEGNEATLEVRMWWKKLPSNPKEYSWGVTIDDPGLDAALKQGHEAYLKNINSQLVPATTTDNNESEKDNQDDENESESDSESKIISYTKESIAKTVHHMLPYSVLFNADSGLLPDQVDINDKYEPIGKNSAAAKNFLLIAEIDLKKLISADRREREYILNRANDRISQDFNSFWTQTIGQKNKLTIRCEQENYGTDAGDKIGKPHLRFWIGDGNTQLYPKQRSHGVRWFISFYLQLRATEKDGGQCIFLMDEPGANLHPKAQGDVLRLINKLSKDINIAYSTHSASLVEYSKLYRVHAVQRIDDADESPTEVIDAHRLGAASTDTLSPLLMAMGMDFSHQNVIQKTRNVLLEEISGFYYLNAFWAMTKQVGNAYFIACTGANNIPTIASMFRGWGLDFICVLDDENQGRGVFNQLKKDFFADNDEIANKYL